VKKVKKDNVTAENIGEIILCQIPTVSSVTAISIMKQFGTFPALMTALQQDSTVLDKVMCGSGGESDKKRKISKTSVKKIKEYLVGQK
jgi:ERCC4-type nuclease